MYWKKWYGIFLKISYKGLKNMYLIAGLMTALVLLTGCYDGLSREDDLRTVPTTNNPHVHPGYERPTSLPQMQY